MVIAPRYCVAQTARGAYVPSRSGIYIYIYIYIEEHNFSFAFQRLIELLTRQQYALFFDRIVLVGYRSHGQLLWQPQLPLSISTASKFGNRRT